MPFYAVQVTIWPTSNLVADASTNTFSIEAANPAGLATAVDQIVLFYQALGSFYPNTVRQSDHSIKCYNRADVKPRAPVLTRLWSFVGAPTGTPLPSEVCLCCSFQAAPLSGTPQSRRRGRVYIGPLKDANLGSDGRPAAGLTGGLASAAAGLLAASDVATTWLWVVHSSFVAIDVPVTNGWVDNEYDTQRRRGRTATARTTFT